MLPIYKGKIWFYRHPVDFRKQMVGLIEIVRYELDQEPGNGDLYVFRSKRRNTLKMIMWQDDGFWLLQKKFEEKLFKFPSIRDHTLELNHTQIQWLLSGLSIFKAPATKSRGPSCVI